MYIWCVGAHLGLHRSWDMGGIEISTHVGPRYKKWYGFHASNILIHTHKFNGFKLEKKIDPQYNN